MVFDALLKFDLDAELARVDRRPAALHADVDRAYASASGNIWLWSLALIVPIAVGAVLADAL